MLGFEKTQIVFGTQGLVPDVEQRLHCLEFLEGQNVTRRQIVDTRGVRIGRMPPADIIFAESDVSREHCAVSLLGGQLYVADLGSTNGTFVDGTRIEEMTALPVGGVIQIGHRQLKHEWRTRAEIAQAEERDGQLREARSYVQALLPAPQPEGPIRADWVYEPSAQLGGDAFGYGRLSDDLYIGYLIDVAGHGVGAALHCVAVMNQLRRKALPATDMSQPAEVLATLNAMYQMEDHSELYFTIWYGVYDVRTRRLTYASAGHHPAYLIDGERRQAVPMHTRNLMIGAVPGISYRQASIEVPPGSSLFLFSDGVFEIVDQAGKEWSIDDFVPLMLHAPVAGWSESQRLHRAVLNHARPGPLDDDFSLLVLAFD